MQRTKRLLAALLVISAVEMAIVALPALAGDFPWVCQFTHRCVSRTWSTPNAGVHKITKTDADCPGPGNQMRVRLVKERFLGDLFFPWKYWDCGPTDQTKQWSSPEPGNFHFDIEKNDTDDTYWAWTVYGYTVYP